MGPDQGYAITKRRLLDSGTCECLQRGDIFDHALLNGGFKPPREGKATDREHRVAKLQQARELNRIGGRGPLPDSFCHC